MPCRVRAGTLSALRATPSQTTGSFLTRMAAPSSPATTTQASATVRLELLLALLRRTSVQRWLLSDFVALASSSHGAGGKCCHSNQLKYLVSKVRRGLYHV